MCIVGDPADHKDDLFSFMLASSDIAGAVAAAYTTGGPYSLTSQCYCNKVAASCQMLAVYQRSPQKAQVRLVSLLQAV